MSDPFDDTDNSDTNEPSEETGDLTDSESVVVPDSLGQIMSKLSNSYTLRYKSY